MGEFFSLENSLGLAVVAIPALMFAALGLSSLVGKPLPERATEFLVWASTLAGLLAAGGMLTLMLTKGSHKEPIDFGDWAHISQFHFHVKLVFDRLSVPFVILSFLLCGVIGKFATKYLHREPGFNRFFVLYSVFLLGMVLTSLAGTIETLFTGWELVGVSSALLVAFFQERPAPVRNGLRVWAVYRVSDAALLVAAVVLHHLRGEGDFGILLGTGAWPEGRAELPWPEALLVGSLLLIAAAGKSGLVPFSGWLPRAMEGPTPSSAVFYGALSVHLGAFLLLRVSPLIERSPLLCGIIVALGLLTALFAALAARVQSDIKSALAFASLTQVGLIVAEIGLGLRYIALIHILGHACLRTLQFVRASTLLQDYRVLENALGQRLPGSKSLGTGLIPAAARRWFYRLAAERGYFDALLADYLVRPALRIFQACDGLERRWTDFLSWGHSRESDDLSPAAGSVEDVS